MSLEPVDKFPSHHIIKVATLEGYFSSVNVISLHYICRLRFAQIYKHIMCTNTH